jgi:phospholipid/cholesterol/gamma-HCH transport system substrate-binding protein
MISRLTKIQLVIFAIVTVIGGAFVGGRYAQIDRLVIDRTFPVYAQFNDSGGIFTGAQVTYRGTGVGEVGELKFDGDGVRVRLDIEKSAPKVPEDVLAVVANKSAIGEQFVDLQPRGDAAPYLAKGTVIPERDTRIPIDTTTLLVDVNSLVSSVDTGNLQIVVEELGKAFEGTGQDLGTILDTSNEFITAADDNIDVTRELIRSSGGVLQTQIDKQSQLSSFATDLALLSDTLVEADPDLRRLLDKGTGSARTVADVVDENAAGLESVVRDLRSATEPLAENYTALSALSILYPYVLEGGYTVAAPSVQDKGEYDAHFGLVLTPEPTTCEDGYRERREPNDLRDREFELGLDCQDDSKVARNPSKTELNRSATASESGKDSWKWLLLAPATN